MKKSALIVIGIMCTGLFVACPSPVTSPSPSPTPQAPTVANLTGTWVQNSTFTSSIDTTVTVAGTTVYQADGSLSVSGISTTVVTGSSPATSTTYVEYKGTYSTNGNQVTTNITEMRSSASAFPDTTSGWVSYAYSAIVARLIVGNKIYTICSPVGSFSGIVGDWELDGYSNVNSTPAYIKMVFTFAIDGSVTSKGYSSSTSTFSDTPTGTLNGTYSNNNDGTYSIGGTIYSAGTIISSVAIVGGYLIFPDLYATKQ